MMRPCKSVRHCLLMVIALALIAPMAHAVDAGHEIGTPPIGKSGKTPMQPAPRAAGAIVPGVKTVQRTSLQLQRPANSSTARVLAITSPSGNSLPRRASVPVALGGPAKYDARNGAIITGIQVKRHLPATTP